MSNFLKFIEEDSEAKKALISSMPTNNKRNIKKFNEKIDSVTKKYEEYKEHVKKYLTAKSKSFDVKESEDSTEKINKKIDALERVKFVLNPTNSYFEKMGFDNLLYEISNYYDHNFKSLNEIIDKFLSKFELAGISLHSDDFDYTPYVNEYMSTFFEVKYSKSENYDKVFETFEKIYWVNPEIISHIELNFRKLIKKYEKKFNSYINKLKNEEMLNNKIFTYNECLEKLKETYEDLAFAQREDIGDIISLAKSGILDINSFFEESKARTTAYATMIIDSSILMDKTAMNKFYDSLEKLKSTIEEYGNYVKFLPLINDFRLEYQSLIPANEKDNINKTNSAKSLKFIESQIADKESKLKSIKRKIRFHLDFLKSKNENKLNKLKNDSVEIAQQLGELYKTYDKEYFKDKVLNILNKSLTISDLLHLYYSFDYFKKMAIKKVFEINNYEEIIKYSDNFDLYSMDLTNLLVNSTFVFEENNISKVIMNKYRLDNINLNDENLNPDDLNPLLDKVKLLLRINVIENSDVAVEKIWFMIQVEKFIKVKEEIKK
jgi:hypothetical protein